MNLQHERIATLCDTLNLPFVAQGYGAAAQEAAKREMGYSDFLAGFSPKKRADASSESKA